MLEAVVLIDRIESVFAGLNIDAFGVGHLPCCLVELLRIVRNDIHIVGLVVDLGRIDAGRHDQGCIHAPTTLIRQELSAKVQKSVHEQHNAVLITIALIF